MQNNWDKIHRDFPFIHAGRYTYFDNSATHQLSQKVICRVKDFYEQENVNPLRGGLYEPSVKASQTLANARAKIANFMGAEANEIIFTKNATESINLAAEMIEKFLSPNDEIIIFGDSHHSNILPWLKINVKHRVVMAEVATLRADDILAKTTPSTKLVIFTDMSNATGKTADTKNIAQKLAEQNILTFVDITQSMAHRKVDAKNEGFSMAAWSGHKIGAPAGIGVLYVEEDLLKQFSPSHRGGGAVDDVNINDEAEIQFSEGPAAFEPGTLNMAGIVGLEAATDYILENQPDVLFARIAELGKYLEAKLKEVPQLELISANNGIALFNIAGVHPHDTAQVLADAGICVRAGYHCAEPLLEQILKVGPAVRISLSFYNNESEIDALVSVLKTVRRKMGYEK